MTSRLPRFATLALAAALVASGGAKPVHTPTRDDRVVASTRS